MEQKKYDIVVIGGGPAGYVAAIRASQLGMQCAVIEKRKTLGGTCLNVGCIPTKALLDSTHKYIDAQKHFSVHGILADNIQMDVPTMVARKNKVVDDVCAGVDFLMKKNKIDVYHGNGSFVSAHEVLVKKENSEQETLYAEKIVIASGSQPVGKNATFAGIQVDEKNVITSDAAISLEEIPQNLLIVGAGVIGLELGSVWARLGAKVQIVEMLPRLLPSVDKQISVFLERSLKSLGLEFFYSHAVEKISQTNNSQLQIDVKNNKNQEVVQFTADKILIAVGRKAYTENLSLQNIGLQTDQRGKIKVNENYQTAIENVYAIGDVIDGLMLAHKAMEEGEVVAEIIAGKNTSLNYNAIPSVVYTAPELAWLGKSEEDLKSEGINFVVGKIYVKGNGRARAMEESEGLIKIIAEKDSGKILSGFVLAPNASEMIAQITRAIEEETTLKQLASVMQAHPTVSELIREAALNALGISLHA